MARNEATQRQIDSADPKLSTWLAANAGSGKTRVLTDRVARLLLDGVSPQNILCLTYTKAAASEMQNRLFKRLGQWSMMPDADLRAELEELGVSEIGDTTNLVHARTLFARALETPGGLKIQTIHSFCSSLLRRFPLEAGVTPFFKEMDDRAANILRADVLDTISQSDNSDAVRNLAEHYSGEDFSDLAGEVIKHQEALMKKINRAEVWDHFEIPEGFSAEDLLAETFLGSDLEMLEELASVLLKSDKSTDNKAAARLSAATPGVASSGLLSCLIGVLLTGPTAKSPYTAKVDQFPTKAIRENNPELITRLNDLMVRVQDSRDRRNRLMSAKRTLAMREFAQVYLAEYAAQKMQRGWLDFDDLILKARNLLVDPSVAQWVLFRLDGGIDHILVDEAQDTSPLQWQVVRLLTQEFGAGVGANPNLNRTIFVVGDLKQSIYSFQGADPKSFHAMQDHFKTQLGQIGLPLQQQSLEYSFRSSSAVLQVVDATFARMNSKGIGDAPHHLAFQSELPGRVDLWPTIGKGEEPEEKEWYDPTDKIAANDHRVLLAQKIADQIADMIKHESLPDNEGGFVPVNAGDFLILVQRRSELFHEIIRACKANNLPIAGADRLKIGAELAVKDISAVLAFLAMPDDDLSLAAALRSPLFGITEAQLFDLAHNRTEKRLWLALSHRKDEFPEIVGILNDLRNQADFQSPYDLIERILTRHDGRHRLLARLGPEAEDGIDALASQALAYEMMETPSLTGFISWLESEEVQIKRQAESAGDKIRVMTTHGAKGLEAPIVILPDTAAPRSQLRSEVLVGEDMSPIWKSKTEFRTESESEIIDALMAAQEEERHRLLYVALTRAEKWLIICGSGDLGDEKRSWHKLVEAGMADAGAAVHSTLDGPIMRLEHGAWPERHTNQAPVAKETKPVLPEWALVAANPPEKAAKAISPSGLTGEKFILEEGDGLSVEAAMLRGTQIHLLLENLPYHDQTEWSKIAQSMLAGTGVAENTALFDSVFEEAKIVLTTPELSHVFGPETLAEVDVSASLSELEGQRIHGTIDRLIVGEKRVSCIDFKSNAVVPSSVQDVPEGIINQMAAYAAALAEIYPDKVIETSILWTKNASLMALPHDIVRNAKLHAATS